MQSGKRRIDFNCILKISPKLVKTDKKSSSILSKASIRCVIRLVKGSALRFLLYFTKLVVSFLCYLSKTRNNNPTSCYFLDAQWVSFLAHIHIWQILSHYNQHPNRDITDIKYAIFEAMFRLRKAQHIQQ